MLLSLPARAWVLMVVFPLVLLRLVMLCLPMVLVLVLLVLVLLVLLVLLLLLPLLLLLLLLLLMLMLLLLVLVVLLMLLVLLWQLWWRSVWLLPLPGHRLQDRRDPSLLRVSHFHAYTSRSSRTTDTGAETYLRCVGTAML
jgi:hypothetical protein